MIAVRQTLEQELAHMREAISYLVANQELIVSEISELQATDEEILKTTSARPPQPATPAQKPIPTPPSSSRGPTASPGQ